MSKILQFKSLTLEDKFLFETYTNQHKLLSYEYTFPSLYLWRKLCNVRYAIIDDALIIAKHEESKGCFFMQPLGYKKENLEAIIIKLLAIREEYPCNFLFGDVSEEFIEDIRTHTKFNICSTNDRNDAEYIYSTEELISLKGKKFHKKKNHYNGFVKNYTYEIKDVTDCSTKNDCMELLKRWHDGLIEEDKELQMETEAINDILCKVDILNLKTFAAYVEGKIVGFSVGEIYADGTMANILVEKADVEYKGVYAFINKEFLEKHFNTTQFVNRQEDTGSEGLRIAKLSYNPVRMEEKYLINLRNV